MGREIREKLLEYDEDAYLLAVESGGTSATTAPRACANLGAISNSETVGVAGGVVPALSGVVYAKYLNTRSVFPPTILADGLTVNPGKTLTLTVTNFSLANTYTVICSAGAVSMVGAQILYTAPNQVTDATVTVNDRVIPISVRNPTTGTPAITFPVSGTDGIRSTFTVTTNAFSVIVGSDTHQATDWQVATDMEFANLIVDHPGDTVNLTSYEVTGLADGTLYYVRARFKGTVLGYGAWSPSIVVKTSGSHIASLLVSTLVSPDGIPTTEFADALVMTPDARMMVVTARRITDDIKYAYVYTRANGTWLFLQRLEITAVGDEYLTNMNIAKAAISNDGKYIALAASNNWSRGRVYVYVKTDTGYVPQAVLMPAAYVRNNGFDDISISSDGSRIVTSAAGAFEDIIGYGCVYVFTRTGSTWIEEARLVTESGGASDYFGSCIALSGGGTVMAVSATSSPSGSGYVNLYKRQANSTWSKITTIAAPISGSGYGSYMGMSSQADTLVVGNPNTGAMIGAVYIYALSPSLTASAPITLTCPNGTYYSFGGDLQLSSNGRYLLTTAYNGDLLFTLYGYQLDTVTKTPTLLKAYTNDTGDGATTFGKASAFSDDATWLAATGYNYTTKNRYVYMFN